MKPALVLLALLLAGCATSERREADQIEAIRLHYANQRPLVRIEALPGQTITGLASIEINAPSAAPILPPEQPHPVWQTINSLLPFIATIGVANAVGRASIGVANSVGAVRGSSNVTTTNTSTVGATTTTNTSTTAGATTNTTSTVTGSYNPSTNTSTTSGSYNPVTTSNSNNPATTTTSTSNTSTTTGLPNRICAVATGGTVITCQ